MLEIWGRRNSSNVIAVMWAVGELELLYKRINIGGGFGGNDSAEYRALNPNGLVPTMNDDGKVLWESNAIVRYLCQVYGADHLWPADPYQRARADQWMDWVKTSIYPAFTPIFLGLIRTPAEQQNPDSIAAAAVKTGKLLSMADNQLAKSQWLGGDSFTMGDIPLGAVIYRYFSLPIERPALPALEDWYQRLCEREAYQKHVMIPFGESLADWQRLEKEGADIQ